MCARGGKRSEGWRLGEAAGDGGSDGLGRCKRGPEEDRRPHEVTEELYGHGGCNVGGDATRRRKVWGSCTINVLARRSVRSTSSSSSPILWSWSFTHIDLVYVEPKMNAYDAMCTQSSG